MPTPITNTFRDISVLLLRSQRDGRVGNDRRVALFALRADEDLVALAPGRGLDRLSGEQHAGEARLIARDLRGVAAEQAVYGRLAHDPERAQAVQDRLVEATELCERRIGVPGDLFARPAVRQGPVRGRSP